jgi:hypothetical protein
VVKRPVRTTLIALLAFVMLVPVWPYKPHCGIYSSATFRTMDGEMTPEFLEAIDQSLSRTNVYHLRIGNSIYLRLLIAIDPSGDFDFGADMLNAQLQAVAGLVSPRSIWSLIGEELNGRIYTPPTYLTQLYEEDESLVFGDDCTFVRAVAFGEPPPPGYEPEPWFLDAAPVSE